MLVDACRTQWLSTNFSTLQFSSSIGLRSRLTWIAITPRGITSHTDFTTHLTVAEHASNTCCRAPPRLFIMAFVVHHFVAHPDVEYYSFISTTPAKLCLDPKLNSGTRNLASGVSTLIELLCFWYLGADSSRCHCSFV